MVVPKGRRLTDDEVKATLVDMLVRMNEVLRREKIPYFLYYGTLLGAVRHKGIIPWDDDVDLAMFRADFDKLALIDWAASGLEFVSHQTRQDYPYMCGKVTHRQTILEQNYDHPIDIGLYVDIFSLDDMPQGFSGWLSEQFLRVLKMAQVIKMIRPRRTRSQIKNTVLMLGKVLLRPVQTGAIVRLAHQVAARKVTNPSQVASRLGPYGNREVMESSFFIDTVELEFGSERLSGPAGWKEILTALYGDYMTPPPLEDRVSTHSMVSFFRDASESHGPGRHSRATGSDPLDPAPQSP